MNKNVLLGKIDKFYHNMPRSGEALEVKIALRSIVKQHFSVSEQEKEEAREWIEQDLEFEKGETEPSGQALSVYKTILKALGGLE